MVRPMSDRQQANDQAWAQLERNLTNHTPDGRQIAAIEQIRRVAKDFGKDIIVFCPPGRERSLALTALEDTVMRAVQSIVTEGH